MTRLGVVVGSTRPGREADAVAEWVTEAAGRHPAVASGAVAVDCIDLADVALPLLDEPVPAVFGGYRHEHTRRWAATVAALDGFVFVTPEYNHSVPAALKNAIDFLFGEWNHEPAGFVSYGLQGGVRAVEHLKLVLAEVKAVPVGLPGRAVGLRGLLLRRPDRPDQSGEDVAPRSPGQRPAGPADRGRGHGRRARSAPRRRRSASRPLAVASGLHRAPGPPPRRHVVRRWPPTDRRRSARWSRTHCRRRGGTRSPCSPPT